MALLTQYALIGEGFSKNPDTAFKIGIVPLMSLSAFESLFEELIFRFAPIYIVFRYGLRINYLIIAVLLSSISFGLYHINSTSKAQLMVAGLIYCGVFLLSGGLSRNFKKAISSTWVVHATLNLSWIYFRLAWTTCFRSEVSFQMRRLPDQHVFRTSNRYRDVSEDFRAS